MTEQFKEVTGDDVDRSKGTSPFYLLADRSQSMEVNIDTVNRVLARVIGKLSRRTDVRMNAQVGIISFGQSAILELPATTLTAGTPSPKLEAHGQTYFSEAFGLLWEDYQRLLAENQEAGIETHRAVAWLFTDGQVNPRDQPWRETLHRIIDDPKRPHIFTFGIGSNVREEELREMATELAWFHPAATPEQVTEALEKWADTFVGTLVGTLSRGKLTYETPAYGRSLPPIPVKTLK